MTEKFIVWSGHKNNPEKEMKTLFEYTDSQTKKVYFWFDCMLLLSDKGKVFCKGVFPFEKEENSSQVKEDEKKETVYEILKENEIQKIKLGNRHALFLDKNNEVYALGDNKYGQLGLGKSVLLKREPVKIEKLKKIRKIKVYQDSSFAIDFDNKLYIWGDSSFSGKYKGNIFTPKHIYRDLSIKSIYFDNDNILINSDPIESNELIQRKMVERMKIDRILNKINENDNNENEIQKKKKKAKQIETIKFDTSEMLINMKDFIKEDLYKMIEYIHFKDDFLLNKVRDLINKEEKLIVKNLNHSGILNIDKIFKILKCEEKETLENENMTESVFFYFANTSISTLKTDFQKFCDSYYEKIKSRIPKRNNINDYIAFEKHITYYLLPYAIKIKKIESLIYKISLNNIVLNTYEVKNVIDALEQLFIKSNRYLFLNKLVNEKYEMITQNLIPYFDKHFKEIIKSFFALSNSKKYVNKEAEGKYINKDIYNILYENEHLIYKIIVESVLFSRDLLKMTQKVLKDENDLREEVNNMKNFVKDFQKLRVLQINLEKIRYYNNDEINFKEKKNFEKMIDSSLKEVDGIINRIFFYKDRVLNEEYKKLKEVSNDEKCSYMLSILSMYISSLLETAFYKKTIFFLIKYIMERKKGKINFEKFEEEAKNNPEEMGNGLYESENESSEQGRSKENSDI